MGLPSSVVQLSLSLLNDAALGGVALPMSPHVLACACIECALHILLANSRDKSTSSIEICTLDKYAAPESETWWRVYGVTDDALLYAMRSLSLSVSHDWEDSIKDNAGRHGGLPP